MNLDDIKKGASESGDCGNPMDRPPEWMDFQRFFRGQEFIKKHLFAIFIALHCSLTSGFSVTNLLVPLMYTKQSDNPEKALKRYLATFEHVHSWFCGENIWNTKSKAHQSIKRVRGMHNHVAKSMKVDWPEKNYVSQYDMALVQSGFMAAVVMYPDGFGIRCTKMELEDFIFYWRGLGYLLGISDQYNICKGNFDETYSICKQIEKDILLPALSEPPEGFQLMADAYSEGMNIPGSMRLNTTLSTMAFILDGMGIGIPKLGWSDWFRFMRFKILVWLIMWFPGFESFINKAFTKDVLKNVGKYVGKFLSDK